MSEPVDTGRLKVVRIVFCVAVSVALFAGVGAFPLSEPDEGRYAGIAAGMVHTGDWLTPRLDGIRYFEKPPLFFWTAAGAISLFGPSEFAVRLPSVLATLATVFLVLHWTRDAIGPGRGLLAAAILATTPLVAGLARIALVDLVLMACTTFACFAGWKALVEPEPREPARNGWVAAFWCACAFAFLTKGPIGVVLPLSGLVANAIATRSPHRILELVHSRGVLLFVLLVAPWYVAMAHVNPGFAYEFFVEQNLQRFATGGRFEREGTWWTYLPVLLLATLPWTPAVPLGLWLGARAYRRRPGDVRDRLRVYLSISFGVGLLILSIAQSKRAYYLLPLLPPLAMLTSDALICLTSGDRLDRVKPWIASYLWLAAGCVLSLALAIAFADSTWGPVVEALEPKWLFDGGAPDLVAARLDLARSAVPSMAALFAALALAAGSAGLLVFRRRLASAASVAVGAILGVFAILPWLVAPLGELYSSRAISAVIQERREPGERILLYPRFVRGIPFYLGEPVILFSASHQEFGRSVGEPEVPRYALQKNGAALRELLRTEPSLLVVVPEERYAEDLRGLSPGSTTVLHRGLRYTLLRCRLAVDAG